MTSQLDDRTTTRADKVARSSLHSSMSVRHTWTGDHGYGAGGELESLAPSCALASPLERAFQRVHEMTMGPGEAECVRGADSACSIARQAPPLTDPRRTAQFSSSASAFGAWDQTCPPPRRRPTRAPFGRHSTQECGNSKQPDWLLTGNYTGICGKMAQVCRSLAPRHRDRYVAAAAAAALAL